MSARALLVELHAAGIRLTLAGDELRFQTRPGVSIAPYRERVKANKSALLAELGKGSVVVGDTGWHHVYQGPVTASLPPSGWNGTICADCQWPGLCTILGPRGARLPGGPCPAFHLDELEAHHGH